MGEITQLLDAARDGDPAASERLFAHIYAELDRLARGHLARGSALTTLDPPALVHEAYLRLAQQSSLPGRDRRAFLAYASRVMRSIIIDYVRSRQAERHGGGLKRVTLNTSLEDLAFADPELDSLGTALESLARIDERAHTVVEMRYFGGMEVEEIAEHLDISPATVKRDWQKARAFLLHAIRSTPVDAT
jgi:RNA polymerase sigma factor (TIGR02999 family)